MSNVASPASDLIIILANEPALDALHVLLDGLSSARLAAVPVIVALDLEPSRLAALAVQFQRRLSLPITAAVARQRLDPSQIYLLSTRRAVGFEADQLRVLPTPPAADQGAVDAMLAAAAERYGDRLIAVFLGQHWIDGAIGAIELNRAGGTVIVERDGALGAAAPSPRLIPPSAISFDVGAEAVAGVLGDLLSGAGAAPEPGRDDLLRQILEQVNRQASIDFRAYKTSTIVRRIGRRMAITHQRTMRDYLQYLREHPAESGELAQAFLINVTQFFRDGEAFAYLRGDIIPQLIESGRRHNRVIRIWSAGCATGEEPYSLAMLLADALGAELPEWSIKIFATDLDEAAITFARLGIYAENLLRGAPPDYRERFFERTDHGYRIVKTLRQMVIFGQQDLSASAPFPRIDMVLCRNVLIYFTPELQNYILNQLAYSLRPNDGFLFLGKAEIIRAGHAYYEPINRQWKIYRCTGEAVPLPRRNDLGDTPGWRMQPQSLPRPQRQEPASGAPVAGNPLHDMGQLRRLNEQLLRFLPSGVVVIDRSYRLLTANPAARRLLALREVSSEQDFLHAVRGIPYSEVRSAIDTVFRERTTVTLPEIELEAHNGGNGRHLLLTIVPMQPEAPAAQGAPWPPGGLAAISINDITEQVQTRLRLEAAQAEQALLLNELGMANKRLSEMNKELMDANEEFQVANEEMMLTYEELQATNEEFEATNEELQATNEELETNNEELQATNEELQTTNEELRARTSELQDLAAAVENERVRLAEVVELAPFYLLALKGPDLVIGAFNPRYARILEGRKIQGRPLAEVAETFWSHQNPIELAQAAYREDRIFTSPRLVAMIPNDRGEVAPRYFVYTIVPTHDFAGAVDGVVMYGIDQTELLAHESTIERAQLKLIFDGLDRGALALYDAKTGALLAASPQYAALVRDLRRLDDAPLIGRIWEAAHPFAADQRADAAWRALSLDAPQTVADGTRTWRLTPVPSAEQPECLRFVLVLDATQWFPGAGR